MTRDPAIILFRIAAALAILLIGKTTIAILLEYRHYFPPDFRADFLIGREASFFGPYQWAFYSHIVSGPIALLLGVVLVSERIRQRFTKLHRILGRIQVVNVLLFLCPAGLLMSFYAMGGWVAGTAFASLALATAGCLLLGWRRAVQRKFVEHRQWMLRCLVLLCSAVVLRIFGGLATVTGITGEWTYPLAAWASWLLPLAGLEVWSYLTRQHLWSQFHGAARRGLQAPDKASAISSQNS